MQKTALSLALLCVGWLCAAPFQGPPASADEAGDAAALFAGRCATCHAVPDPALRMDLAWLDQVNRTT